MRILVTGGSGFIGSNLVPSLTGHAEVINLDVTPPRNRTSSNSWRMCSILDEAELAKEFRRFKPTHVVHLAARTDLGGTSTHDYVANTGGVRSVMRAIEACGTVSHTLYASSRLIFAIDHEPKSTFDYHPSTPYGESKVMGEELVRSEASQFSSWSIVRPTSIWGPWFDTPYRDFFDMVAKGRYVKFKGRDPLKSFGYVGNVVHQISEILKADTEITNEGVYWLSDYEPLRLSAWADSVAKSLGRRPPRYAPWLLARAAARLGDLATKVGVDRVPLTTFRLNNLVTNMVYDTSATEGVVGPLPYDMHTAVQVTADWYKSQGH
ncbi:NAD(P)-dependent oxidoreductase [uncultured Microbacterium sp.]|uniref:NAD-dependent epimerase/dehydratase family protein n=1 Tax=uncultured Microbacterium sp. TaxID=191216 RepID=UPI0025F01E3C|nr:NAD(P)-dependent oxidoreductase [uncultured Microbacterium sp.]